MNFRGPMPAMIPTSPPPPPPGRALLAATDFTYLGGFRLPGTVAMTGSSSYSGFTTDLSGAIGPIAGRRVGGQVRLFSAGGATLAEEGHFEVNVPADASLSKDVNPSNWPLATVAQTWGQVHKGRNGASDAFGSDASYTSGKTWAQSDLPLAGMYWDDPAGRLYWVYYAGAMDNYDASWHPTFGFSTLDNTAGVNGPLEAYGPFRCSAVPSKATHNTMLAIPQWFADASLAAGGNRKLGLMGGGYFSLVQQGGGSMGPCLVALDPPTTAGHVYASLGGTTEPSGGSVPWLAGTPLMGPFSVGGTRTALACKRPAAWINRYYTQSQAGGTALGGTTTSLSVWQGPGNINAADFSGYTVALLTGPGAGSVATMGTGNQAAGTVAVSPAFTSAPTTSTTYEVFDAKVVSASGNSVTLDRLPLNHDTTAYPWLSAIGGPGTLPDTSNAAVDGQYYCLTANPSGYTFTLDRAWANVPPVGSYVRSSTRAWTGFLDDGGPGYSSWGPGDNLLGGMAWVDDDAGDQSKHGILVLASLGFAEIWYANSNLRNRGRGDYWLLFDPADLAAVAAGTKAASAVQPVSWWPATHTDASNTVYPGYAIDDTASNRTVYDYSTDPTKTYSFMPNGNSQCVAGCWYDPTAKRLYVSLYQGWLDGYESKTTVVVYQVGG